MVRRKNSRRRRFEVEGLESRRLLAYTFSSAPLAAQGLTPSSITLGPDGNIYFALSSASEIGELNTTTGALSYYGVPGSSSQITSLMSDGHGSLYFADYNGGAGLSYLGVLPTSTHKLVQIPLVNKATNARAVVVGGMVQGADGNLYFTDAGNNAIGKFVINDPAHPITEAKLPTAVTLPSAIFAAPNGVIFFGSAAGLSAYNPTNGAFVTAKLAGGAQATSFALGGNDRLYFSASGQLESIDPNAALTTAAVVDEKVVGVGVIAPEPSGNIAFSNVVVGEFNVTTGTAATYALPPGFSAVGGTVSGAGGMVVPNGGILALQNGSLVIAETGFLGVGTPIAAGQSTITGQVLNATFGAPAGTGVSGQLVYLDLKNDGRLDPGDPSMYTGLFGGYTFTGVPPGTYIVRLAGVTSTYLAGETARAVTTASGQNVLAAALGLPPLNSVLPLTLSSNPFGLDNPDAQTAEVIGLYQTILGRAPTSAELAAWVPYLKVSGSSVMLLAQQLLDSPEYETALVASYFAGFLGRTASLNDIGTWVVALHNGATEDQVVADFLTSAEFNAAHPDNASFVEALFVDVLGRAGTAAEIAGWSANLAAGMTRAQVVSDFVYSTEARVRELNQMYLVFLGRPIDPVTQASYINSITSGTTLAVAASQIIGSAEYAVRARVSLSRVNL